MCYINIHTSLEKAKKSIYSNGEFITLCIMCEAEINSMNKNFMSLLCIKDDTYQLNKQVNLTYCSFNICKQCVPKCNKNILNFKHPGKKILNFTKNNNRFIIMNETNLTYDCFKN